MDQRRHDKRQPSERSTDGSATVDLSRTGFFWALALLAGISIAAWSAASDRKNRSKLEKAVEHTAVGDKRFFNPEASPATVLLLGGKKLVPASKSPEPRPDSRMRLEAYTDDASFRLYVPEERPPGDTETGGLSWYIKVERGQFLRLTY